MRSHVCVVQVHMVGFTPGEVDELCAAALRVFGQSGAESGEEGTPTPTEAL